MSQDLTAKQRDSAFQHWCSQITRESRDLAALDRMSARALQDRDVRNDPLLQSMIRAEVERIRTELQREMQREEQDRRRPTPPPQHYPSAARHVTVSRSAGYTDTAASSVIPPSTPLARPLPDPDEVALHQLLESFTTALKGGDEDAAQTLCAKLRTLHSRRSEIVSAAQLEQCEQRITRLHDQLDDHRRRIAEMAEQARLAAQAGDAHAVLALMHRLTAIHVAHPRLLDDAGLRNMHAAVARANEGHDDRLTTRKLIARQRAVASELKRLAGAVSAFHRAVFNHPESRAEYQRAALGYAHALRGTRLHEKDWLTDFVLELADVLAKWNVPPPGAEEQIDRFLETLRVSLKRIHRKIGEIDRRHGGLREA